MDADLLVSFLTSAVRVATPLLLAALGETLAERGGVINLGIEGVMLAGALAAAIGSTAGGPWAGTFASAATGALLSLGFGLIAVAAGANQIITGTAVTLGAVGATGAVYREVYGSGGVGLSLPTFRVVPIPGLDRIPLLGPALFEQSILSYLGYVAVPAIWFLLFRTRWGLALRAAGESVEAATAAGVRVKRVRIIALTLGGMFAGIAGASLVLAQVGTFAEKMTAGRGFMAVAIVVLGGWRPGRVAWAALFFGGAMALQFLFQSMLLNVPYQLFLMLPYLLTLLVLVGAVGRVRSPAELGRG
ncbi:MAG TPA: ABC transporter permease [Gemmatimonadales bacterium]|jgi:simple sugar transport system permease protein